MKINSLFDKTLLRYLPLLASLWLLAACGGAELPPSHSVQLTEEFSLQRGAEIDRFQKYLQLEQRLFKQQDKQVYAATDPARSNSVARYSSGSLADPRGRQPNWNRSFELDAENARGGIFPVSRGPALSAGRPPIWQFPAGKKRATVSREPGTTG